MTVLARPLVATALVGLVALAAPTPALAEDALPKGRLTRIATGDLAYRWARGSVRFELRDRGARWSKGEAKQIGAAFDKIPDVVIRKAKAAGVGKIYRDPHPRNRKGVRKSSVTATAEVRNGYISMGDTLLVDRPDRIYEVLIHELGHCVHYGISGRLLYEVHTPGWTSLSWTSAIHDGLKSWNGFVTDYARKNDHEDFAESVEYYWLAPDELRKTHPGKYRFMRDVVFEGAVSPAASRQKGKEAIDPVRPQVERLGDAVDTPGSLVKVYGQRFMGPLDGGYNRVRYRGKRALHLPVSRRKIVSWVPLIGTGSAPITVTTQDGRSNAAAFRIKKPWWKFW